ncbi:GNAT family N-acetyltransferase [Duganella sp. CT11-25]|uniref:GNAT family N-acetyltransferase n=1 Tax=unclassified Duganella TaxID=2636909 RepID=UPI0039B00EA0
MPLQLRAAQSDDKPFLARLEEDCMRDYATALWGIWRPRPDDTLRLDTHRIILKENAAVGCVSITRHADHAWLEKLYITPASQRQGIGALVLQQLISEANASSLPLRLSVLTTNPARAFYEREGLCVYERNDERFFMSTMNEPGHGAPTPPIALSAT